MNKKIFYFAAAAALTLTACTSEEDFVQTGEQTQAESRAIAFDTYTAGTTRAGDPEGVMTTDKLKTAGKGFGVFAMYQDNADYNSSLAPNFMFNEQVHWSGGWTYSPLKYWPNETTADSQDPAADANSTEVDKLSFFAYAPYVSTGSGNTLGTESNTYIVKDATPANNVNAWTGSQTYGISAISRENVTGDPLVEWMFSSDIDKNVDLLWGVAPAGNLSYQTVNPSISITKTFGLPLTDMVKPSTDQKIKFLFQHALSRIGLTVVSAIDQIDAGDAGEKFKQAQTRVLIDEVKVWGDFGIKGTLNLNNTTANKANWIDASIVESASTEASPLFDFTVANGKISKDLRYENITNVTGAANASAASTAFAALNPGVTPSEKLLLASGPDNGIPVTDYTYELGKKLYTLNASNDYVLATTTATEDVDVYTKEASGNYTQVKAQGGGSEYITMSGETPEYLKLTVTGPKTASTDNIAIDAVYYTRTGAAGSYVYTYHKNTTGSAISDATEYYEISNEAVLAANEYAHSSSEKYYTSLSPRYFMVVPSQQTLDPTENTVNVKITYHVVTYDSKLNKWVSDVKNTITKQEKIAFKSGKSYNLKLILGLTSVKLDAVVSDWQVGDDAEVYLPKNN